MKALRRFIKLEAAGGILLFLAAILAMIIANSPLAGAMSAILNERAAVIVGPLAIDKSVLLWINDGLMAVFFLLIGLELKREVLRGELSQFSKLAMPLIAAVGGFLLPAAIFSAVNYGDEVALRGWAIPAATDIAFALGVLSLFGSRIPLSVKVFLASLAIIDDLAAIAVIALFYTSELSMEALVIAGGGIVVLAVMNALNVTRIAAYMIVGVVIWIAVLKSGIHATLAGVIVAFAIPMSVKTIARNADTTANGAGTVGTQATEYSPLRSLEHSLHPWVAYAILPVFALANAGVSLQGLSFDMLLNPLTLGIVLGLFVGKQVGVLIPLWLGFKWRWFTLPNGANMPMLYGVALATGIGFTMSFFIGSLAYEDLDPALASAMKLGVMGGSLLSLVAAIVVLLFATRLPATSPASVSAPGAAPESARVAA